MHAAPDGYDRVETQMPQTLQDWLDSLDFYSHRVPLSELTHRLEGLTVDLEDVGDCLVFGKEHYRRNLMRAGPAYHALILCWRAGQRSPIHDHRGSRSEEHTS